MKKSIYVIAIILLTCIMLVCTSCEEVEPVDGAKMTAVIKSVSEKIEVDVIEGDYEVSGIFWVNIGSGTVIVNQNGIRVTKSSLKVGDVIEITYSGQVMLSYPPQIVALQIQVK